MDENRDGASRPKGLVEYLFAELRHGLQDIRQKVLEEGWFGRVVSAEPVVEINAPEQERTAVPSDNLDRRRTFEELWRSAEHRTPVEPPASFDIER